MSSRFDRYLFTQVGLDSAALTMLGAIVHNFGDVGEYRGTVRRGDDIESTFYVSVDKRCPAAQVNIDLSELAPPSADEGVGEHPQEREHRFLVHPRGYAVFHVSSGSGGYWVNVRKADEDPELEAYDTRVLQEGDIFSAILLRPGSYSMRNEMSRAEAEVSVAYPIAGEIGYRPPAPIDAECGDAIEPRSARLQPGQGLNLHVRAPARIVVELREADDGPASRAGHPRPGWRKTGLAEA